MIPDARGRPFLDHVLSSLADAGLTDICLVIGPDHDLIREHYARYPTKRVQLGFVVQREPTGTADAILAVEQWIAGRDFIALNADNLYPVDAIRALVTLGAPGLIAFDAEALIRESNIEEDRIGAFATLTLHDDGTLATIIEKPQTPYQRGLPRPYISMNLWRFDAAIFDACRAVPLSPRGEHELPLAVGRAVAAGMRLIAVPVRAGVLDLSNRRDIAIVVHRLGNHEIQP